jgi:hypothetical protein
MARKRGGIAGFYDRHKKVIIPAATGLAGLFGTPALGAAVGAAFGGLDRPGKSGIGIDAMGAAKGGLSGYAAGKLGSSLGKMGGIPKIGGLQSAGSKLGSMFTGRLPSMAAGTLPSATSVMPGGLSDDVIYGGGKMAGVIPGSYKVGQAIGTAASKGAGFLKEYEDVLGKAAGGLKATRDADLADEQVRLRIAEEARQFDEAQKLRVRQQGNLDQEAMMTKQQFDELNANRARLRALLTGGM